MTDEDRVTALLVTMFEVTKDYGPEEILSASCSLLAGLLSTAPEDMRQDHIKQFVVGLCTAIKQIEKMDIDEITVVN